MRRMLPVVAILVSASSVVALAADDPDDVLAGKNLIRSGAMYLLRAEVEVKKASDAADAKLKEYQRARAWERDSTRSESEKKALAAALTKQRTAMKQEMAQVLPQLQAQIQALQQQRNMLNQQRGMMSSGGNRFGRMAASQLSGQSNMIGYEISMIQAQSQQINAEYNALGYRIEMLNPRPGSDIAKAQEQQKPKVSADEIKDEYAKALGELRKVVDQTKTQYAAISSDGEIKAALTELDRHSGKVKHTLGPSKRFLDTVKALEQAETNLASNNLDPPAASRAATSKKRKTTRTVKRR